MELKRTGKGIVEETPYGIYVWRCEDGEVFGDDGRIMQIFCMKGDREAIKALAEAAAHYGQKDGKPEFWSGHRPVTDEEYEEQLLREKFGLVPDPLDIAALRDEAEYIRRNGHE